MPDPMYGGGGPPRSQRPAPTSTAFTEAVTAVVAAIPRGEVMSYGEVALLAGSRGAGRAVGQVLARSRGLPWWRVITGDGRLVPGMEVEHAHHLMEEGIAARPVAGPQSWLTDRRHHRLPGSAPTGIGVPDRPSSAASHPLPLDREVNRAGRGSAWPFRATAPVTLAPPRRRPRLPRPPA